MFIYEYEFLNGEQMITVTITNLLAYYFIGLIIWMYVCEAIPFRYHVHAFAIALVFCIVPFALCEFANG